jgi:hypothetical protein
MVASREHRRTYCHRSKRVGKFRGSTTMGCCGGAPARRGGLGSPRLDVADGDRGPVCAATRGTFARPPATGVRCTAHRCHQPRLRVQIRRTRDRCTAHTGGRSSRRHVASVRGRRRSTRLGPQTTTRASRRHCTGCRSPNLRREGSVSYGGCCSRGNGRRYRDIVAFRMSPMCRAITTQEIATSGRSY